MSEPSLALQKLIWARLSAHAPLTQIVPVDKIEDTNKRPVRLREGFEPLTRFPAIVIGDGVTAYADNHETFYDQSIADIHIWSDAASLEQIKLVAGHVRTALATGPWAVEGFECARLKLNGLRMVRFPGTPHSQGILSVEATLKELVS